jgi:hypothetical protein
MKGSYFLFLELNVSKGPSSHHHAVCKRAHKVPRFEGKAENVWSVGGGGLEVNE